MTFSTSFSMMERVLLRFACLVAVLSTTSAVHRQFSVGELTGKQFPHRISDDIYLDPCKAGNALAPHLHAAPS